MVKLGAFLWAWWRANRWAACFIALGVLGAVFGAGAKAPQWAGKMVVWAGGKQLRDAVTNLYETYYAQPK